MAKPIATLDQFIYSLRTNWSNWNDQGEYRDWNHRTNVSYSLPGGSSAPMTETQNDFARYAFEAWDDVIAINLNETTGSSGDITFRHHDASTSYTSTNEDWFGTELNGADIWISSQWGSTDQDSDFQFGNYSISIYLHEIGHSLGLTHPANYDASDSADPTYADNAQWAQDTRKYTVMSYFDADEDGSGTDHRGGDLSQTYASTPLLYDIAAMHRIYGADMTTRTGNTVYGFNSNAGKWIDGAYFNPFDLSAHPDSVFCIWDAGGIDTLDVSQFGMDQSIDLMDGHFSSVGWLTDNVSIAFNAVIENAVGGRGDDMIRGNTVNNHLSGGIGFDTLVGGYGRDTLFGGQGDDRLYGHTDGDASEEFTVEADTLFGGQGNDFLYGGNGNDVLEGGDGIDDLFGGRDHDRLIAGAGNDRLFGEDGADVLRGGDGDDYLSGGEGNDSLFGGYGNDTLEGGAGADVLNGFGETIVTDPQLALAAKTALVLGPMTENGGIDTASYAHASAAVTINLMNGALNTGDAAGDRYLSIDRFVLSQFADTFVGSNVAPTGETVSAGSGADTMNGNAGNDVLSGDDGADRILGGWGDDALFGGHGNDVITGGVGNDLIEGGDENDWLGGDAGADRIDGGNGRDTIVGGGEDDIITGGDNVDWLAGGLGHDTFVYRSTADSFATLLGLRQVNRYDTITDFTSAEDLIDLSAIDANLLTAEIDDAFVFGSRPEPGLFEKGADFTGRVWAESTDSMTMIYGSTDADAVAEFQIAVTGLFRFAETDFIL